MNYYFSKKVDKGFDEALEDVVAELKKEGFGVLTQIDVRDTFKKKLDVDFKNYRILGACNPNFAYQALQAEDKIGTLLPCNAVVEENVDGTVEVSVIDPVTSMTVVNNPAVAALAVQVREKLEKVINGL